MPALGLNQSSSCANPVLDLFTQVNGVLTNVYSIEYQIFEVTTGTPVQVFPVIVGNRATVDVNTDCPTGDRLGTGHYVARWTVPGGELIGTHRITWYFKLLVGSVEQTFTEEFEVLNVVAAGMLGYCLVADVRAEGITVTQASDARVQSAIFLASRFIDQATNRWFEPRARTVLVDGSATPALFLDMPIVGITSVKEDGALIPTTDFKIYNRHLSQGLLNPDDRNNPKLEFFGGDSLIGTSARALLDRRFWRPGQQNIEINGIFGFTDVPSGSSTSTEGITPPLISRLCVLLALRNIFPATSDDAISQQVASRLVEERTRDQSYKLGRGRIDTIGQPGSATAWTDDPEINTLLDMYRAPPVVRTTRL